ncbi:MAG TPA: twin-arginine translocation signal domain-containing protein, partial [Candidatus Cybelea sp.]|nr:twin-arginine translocation signal domain-containing protein [Candidatus Cybelea sp.]
MNTTTKQGDSTMITIKTSEQNKHNRRSFLKTGLTVAGAAVGTGLLVRGKPALAQAQGSLTEGDAAILQFLAAGEALEADFYTQYNELGGIQDDEVPGGTGNRIYTEKLRRIDPNFSQYLHDIADDEI